MAIQEKNIRWDMQVIPTNKPGQYEIEGQANLPDRTTLTVIAVRYLQSDRSTQSNPKPSNATPNRSSDQLTSSNQTPSIRTNSTLPDDPTYSILDYSPVQVIDGEWRTRLNLWQVETDGRYQEPWQLEQPRLNLSWQPDAEVIFLTTVTPSGTLPNLEQLLSQQGLQFPAQTLRVTSDGERFAQISQSIEIQLPTGKTNPGAPSLDDQNDGWGERYIIPKEPQNPTRLTFPENRQTNAPPRTAEFLR
ncbi:MAG: hypothetical protein MUF72_05700 [Elainella sp. Prado103]|nr:hypothetical protein [Elainella sp. Prado103]